MARTLNFEHAVASCKTVSVQDARMLAQGINDKVAELGIQVSAAHRSRTPAPKEKGNLNVRSILHWVESLAPLAADATAEDAAQHAADCDKLAVLSATLGMRL